MRLGAGAYREDVEQRDAERGELPLHRAEPVAARLQRVQRVQRVQWVQMVQMVQRVQRGY